LRVFTVAIANVTSITKKRTTNVAPVYIPQPSKIDSLAISLIPGQTLSWPCSCFSDIQRKGVLWDA
jgi:hypothetical protein